MQTKGSHNRKLSFLISGFDFIRINNISKAKINKKAGIGLPLRAPLTSEKYFVVVPSLITQVS